MPCLTPEGAIADRGPARMHVEPDSATRGMGPSGRTGRIGGAAEALWRGQLRLCRRQWPEALGGAPRARCRGPGVEGGSGQDEAGKSRLIIS